MRALLYVVALFFASNAWAGGIGTVVTTGFHSDPVYFYDSSDNLRQYRLSETIVSYGAGLEIILGDRDDRVMGIFRGYWNQDAPERNPARITSLVSRDAVVSEWRRDPRNVGWATVGVQWGFLGQPENFQVVAVGSMGSGFLTSDHTEFLSAELGAGVAYLFARSFQAYGNVTYQVRYRKRVSHGPRAYAGIRYLFD